MSEDELKAEVAELRTRVSDLEVQLLDDVTRHFSKFYAVVAALTIFSSFLPTHRVVTAKHGEDGWEFSYLDSGHLWGMISGDGGALVSFGLVVTLVVLLVAAALKPARRSRLPGGIAVVALVVVVLLLVGTGSTADSYATPVGKGLVALYLCTAMLAVIHAFQSSPWSDREQQR